MLRHCGEHVLAVGEHWRRRERQRRLDILARRVHGHNCVRRDVRRHQRHQTQAARGGALDIQSETLRAEVDVVLRHAGRARQSRAPALILQGRAQDHSGAQCDHAACLLDAARSNALRCRSNTHRPSRGLDI